MPLIEAIPDEGNIMIHRLITLNSGTSKLPIVTANVSKITLNLGASFALQPSTLNFNDVSAQSEPSGYLYTIADRRLLSSFGGQTSAANLTSRTQFSQTIAGGNSISMTALNSTSLFGNNQKLLTTITVEGRDTGARITIPVEISKTQQGLQNVQAETGITLR